MSIINTPSKSSSSHDKQKTQQSKIDPQSSKSQSPQQQKTSIFNAQKVKENWKQLTELAKKKWSKLTDEEIKRTNGEEEKLTTLVTDKYSINRIDANKQVKGFFAKNSA